MAEGCSWPDVSCIWCLKSFDYNGQIARQFIEKLEADELCNKNTINYIFSAVRKIACSFFSNYLSWFKATAPNNSLIEPFSTVWAKLIYNCLDNIFHFNLLAGN